MRPGSQRRGHASHARIPQMSAPLLWRCGHRLRCPRDGAGELGNRRGRRPCVADLVQRPQRSGATRVCRSPGLVRAPAEPTASRGHLSPRSRRRRALEREVLGGSACRRRVRGDQPGRDGSAIRAVLVRLLGTDRRPRANARHRGPSPPVAAPRPRAGLRARDEHGRPGDAAPRRASSATPRGRGGDGLCHRSGPAVPPAPRGALQPDVSRALGKPYGSVCSRRRCARKSGALPAEIPRAYDARSARTHARAIASAGVPLQVWWSSGDQIVFDQEHQSAALALDLRRLSHCAPVVTYAGPGGTRRRCGQDRCCRSRFRPRADAGRVSGHSTRSPRECIVPLGDLSGIPPSSPQV